MENGSHCTPIVAIYCFHCKVVPAIIVKVERNMAAVDEVAKQSWFVVSVRMIAMMQSSKESGFYALSIKLI